MMLHQQALRILKRRRRAWRAIAAELDRGRKREALAARVRAMTEETVIPAPAPDPAPIPAPPIVKNAQAAARPASPLRDMDRPAQPAPAVVPAVIPLPPAPKPVAVKPVPPAPVAPKPAAPVRPRPALIDLSKAPSSMEQRAAIWRTGEGNAR